MKKYLLSNSLSPETKNEKVFTFHISKYFSCTPYFIHLFSSSLYSTLECPSSSDLNPGEPRFGRGGKGRQYFLTCTLFYSVCPRQT